MNKREFGDRLRAQLAPIEIGDVEIVGNILRFRIKMGGGVKYGSFKFDQLDEKLLDEVVSTVLA